LCDTKFSYAQPRRMAKEICCKLNTKPTQASVYLKTLTAFFFLQKLFHSSATVVDDGLFYASTVSNNLQPLCNKINTMDTKKQRHCPPSSFQSFIFLSF
jgi:hypothetical protein